MKVTPLATGSGVPASSESSIGRTASPEKIERAKAIAMGQEPVPRGTDTQVERTQSAMQRIKMRTQMSQNRHEMVGALPTEELVTESAENVTTEIPIADPSEKAIESEETRPLSPQFAALAKQKRALQVKERELVQREEALKTQPVANGEDLLAKLKANPLSVLTEAGVSYDQLTEAILSNQNAPIDPVKLRAELKEEILKEFDAKFGSRDQAAEAQVLAEIKREADALVANSDQYEAIRTANQSKAVVDLIHRTWKETGEIMDVTTAAELVENQLIEEALPFAKIKKLQSRLTPAQEEQQAEQLPPVLKPNTKIMRTLTNRDNASPIMDRRARAIAAMQGTLKRG